MTIAKCKKEFLKEKKAKAGRGQFNKLSKLLKDGGNLTIVLMIQRRNV